MPIPGLFRRCVSISHEKLATLNLFDSRSSDTVIVRREILTTRLYLLSMVVSTCILIFYTSLSVQTRRETVKDPTRTTYINLYEKYPDTLECPCTRITSPYGSFTDTIPYFHHVCHSDFTSQSWIDFTFNNNSTSLWPMDVRKSMSTMWQLVNTLCISAAIQVNDELNQLGNLSMISPSLISRQLVESRTEAALSSARQRASDALMSSLSIVHGVTQSNELITALSINYFAVNSAFVIDDVIVTADDNSEPTNIGMLPAVYVRRETNKSCSCKNNTSCPMPGHLFLYDTNDRYGFYDLNTMVPNETLPGIVIDCVPLQTALSSSLECFYNQTCLNILLSAYPTPIRVLPLNKSLSKRFKPVNPVSLLVRELFLEDITCDTSFEKYYAQCAPVHCNYSYSHRFDWIYVITALIALLDGLSTVLRLSTPYLIRLFFFVRTRRSFKPRPTQKKESKRSSQPSCAKCGKGIHRAFVSTLIGISMKARVRNVLLKFRSSALEFNVFDQHARHPSRIRQNRLATRLYLCLFLISLSILILYTFGSTQTISVTIPSPSVEHYKTLQQTYGNTLHCPCSLLSIPYEKIINIDATFHQLCESDFVQPQWYENLPRRNSSAQGSGFIYSASSHFQTLAKLCDIANLTITSATYLFLQTLFVNDRVQPLDWFISQTEAVVSTFTNATRADFLYTMSVTHTVLHGEQFASMSGASGVLLKTSIPELGQLGLNPVRIYSTPVQGSDANGQYCDCLVDSTCTVVDFTDHFYLFDTYGIRVGCSIVDGVLQSSLSCWYNLTCMDRIREVFSQVVFPITQNVTMLDSTVASKFPPTVPIQLIYDQVMVERWHHTASFENFFRECNPPYCLYSYSERSSLLYTVTVILGLVGGLNVILRLICPMIVRIFLTCITRINSRNAGQAWTSEIMSQGEFICAHEIENNDTRRDLEERFSLDCGKRST